eukprot:TRINITY_DN4064_c0_g1_i1.p1 TRINITY_DN4064_c0_g1~~TRINITY_DN4064_c0_g1_i1.p1  ORF type:complete len:316 (+),score=68.33 TRINITY_DN4064_c0_g1_i1:43-990(+)
MVRRPPRSTLSSSSAASDVYKRQTTLSTGMEPLREHESQRFYAALSAFLQHSAPSPAPSPSPAVAQLASCLSAGLLHALDSTQLRAISAAHPALGVLADETDKPCAWIEHAAALPELVSGMGDSSTPPTGPLVNRFGETIYRMASQLVGVEAAGKVTGMLLELEAAEQLNLCLKPIAMKLKIEEAVQVLQSFGHKYQDYLENVRSDAELTQWVLMLRLSPEGVQAVQQISTEVAQRLTMLVDVDYLTTLTPGTSWVGSLSRAPPNGDSIDTSLRVQQAACSCAAAMEAAMLPWDCLLYTSPSPRDRTRSRMPSSA